MCSELERDAESGRTQNAMAGLAQVAAMTAMKWARLRSSIRVFGNGRCNGANLGGVVLAPKNRQPWLQVRPELPTPRGGLAMAAPTSDANGNGRAVVVALGGRRTSGEKLDVVESTSVSNGVSFQAEC